jgi:transmembrane sensor
MTTHIDRWLQRHPWWRKRRDRQARRWLARIDSETMHDRALAAYWKWLEKPGADQAIARVLALWDDIDRALLQERLEATRLARWMPREERRTVPIWVPASALAAVLLGVLVLPHLWLTLEADVRTASGETRRVMLDDGSQLELGSKSMVDIAYTASERRIRLLEGEAVFTVARDPHRPFTVAAAGGETTARGTIFLVSQKKDGVTVSGIQHSVSVRTASGEVIVNPGVSVRYGASGTLGNLQPSDKFVASWREGRLVFQNRTLGDLADALQPYTGTWIWVLGSARQKTFNGVIRTADPLNGLLQAARSDNISVTRMPGVVILF